MRARRGWGLLVVLSVLILWQAAIFRSANTLSSTYRDRSAVGLCYENAASYFHTYYYFDVFPAVLPGPHQHTRNREGTIGLPPGSELLMAAAHPCAVGHAGDYLKVLSFLPAAWARGTPKDPTLRPVTAGLFFAGLAGLLLASYWCGCFVLGILLVALLGSNPFQLFEAYSNQNIFSLPISATLIALALNLKFLTDGAKPARIDWLLVSVTGVLLATVREIRAESAAIVVSVGLVYLIARGIPWRRRLVMLTLLFASIAMTSWGWSSYFDRLYDRAVELVRAHGGAVYTGGGGEDGSGRTQHHPLWHSIAGGLSDFGEERGYFWDDRLAYAHNTPLVNAEFGLSLRYEGGYYFENFYTGKHLYRMKPEFLPEYTHVIRERVIEDITGSPGWYAGILLRRVGRVFEHTTPVQLHLPGATPRLPFPAWLALPLLAGLLIRREWFLAKLLAFTAPLSLVALLVYSHRGTTYYAVFPSVAVAITALLVVEAAKSVNGSHWRMRTEGDGRTAPAAEGE